MLQRIKTLYLLTIVVLSCITFFSPVADLVNQANSLQYLVDFKGIYQVLPTGNIFISRVWGVTTFAAIVPIFAFYALVSYKNRIKQIRFCVLNMFIMILYYIALFTYLWVASNRLNAGFHLHLVAIFPLINLIINYLAIGAIGKDEKLVKSMDRIR